MNQVYYHCLLMETCIACVHYLKTTVYLSSQMYCGNATDIVKPQYSAILIITCS